MTGGNAKPVSAIFSLLGATTIKRIPQLKLNDGSGKSGRSIFALETTSAKTKPVSTLDTTKALELTDALKWVRDIECEGNLKVTKSAKRLIEREFKKIQDQSESYPEAVKDGTRGADSLMFRMAAAIELSSAALRKQQKVRQISLPAAKAAVEIYVNHCMPALIVLCGQREDSDAVDVVQQFVCILLDRLKVDRVGKRALARNKLGLDLRSLKFNEFVSVLCASKVASEVLVKSTNGAGAPEKMLVLNQDFISTFNERRMLNNAASKGG